MGKKILSQCEIPSFNSLGRYGRTGGRGKAQKFGISPIMYHDTLFTHLVWKDHIWQKSVRMRKIPKACHIFYKLWDLHVLRIYLSTMVTYFFKGGIKKICLTGPKKTC